MRIIVEINDKIFKKKVVVWIIIEFKIRIIEISII